jgi:hypothetical protein
MSAPWPPPSRPEQPRPFGRSPVQSAHDAIEATAERCLALLDEIEAERRRWRRRQFVVGCLVGLALALVLL